MKTFNAFCVRQEQERIVSRVESVKLDDISPGEVLIKAAYSSVNYKDALAATNKGKIIREFPRIAGIDVSGYVVSSTDPRYREGDSVLVTGYELGVGHDGGYSEYVRVPAEWVVPLPDGLDLREAMLLGTAGFTVGLAIQRLQDNHQKPDQGPILVTGSTGGVGSIAVDVLSGLGYQVTAMTGKQQEHDWLYSLGASEILDRNTLELGKGALEKSLWAGGIDTAGGEILSWMTRTTQAWGNIVSCGLAAGNKLDTSVMPFILRGVALLGVTSSGCPTALRHQIWQRLATDLRPKHFEKIVQSEITLNELPGAFEQLLQGAGKGRILVRIE